MPIITSPPAIIFINNDLSDQVLGVFVRQLFITQVLDGPTFDANVAADGYYPLEIHQDGYRILVVRDLSDHTNRQFADIVLFAKAGLVSVLVNHYGPPGITLPIDQVYLTALINLNKPNACWGPPYYGRKDIYDYFEGFPHYVYNRDYNPRHLDHFYNPEPTD